MSDTTVQPALPIDTAAIVAKVCDLAVRVGKFQAAQRKTFDRKSVESKHSHDYVSYVDRESEKTIVAELRAILPEAGFITEEKTTESDTHDTLYTWVVDPLDGTTNFIHDLGPWCVCIGLRYMGWPVLGVVYEVTRGELFYASQGCGAWMRTADGTVRQIHVSSTPDLDQSLIAVGYPYNADGFRDFGTRLCHRLYGHCASLRSLGSAETELCYVAAGRLEAYVESYLSPWDVCAGAAILIEAGGRISDYSDSDSLWPSGCEVLATNALIHNAMLSEIEAAKINTATHEI